MCCYAVPNVNFSIYFLIYGGKIFPGFKSEDSSVGATGVVRSIF